MITFSTMYVQFMVFHFLDVCQLNWCLPVFLGASEDLTRSSCYLKFFEQLLCSVAFKQIQILIKILYPLSSGMFRYIAVTPETTSFLLP